MGMKHIMDTLKVSKLSYKGKVLGCRVAVNHKVIKGVFDIELPLAKELGVVKYYNMGVINLIAQGNLLISKQEIEKNVVIKEINGNEAKLKAVLQELDKTQLNTDDILISKISKKLLTKYRKENKEHGTLKTYQGHLYRGIDLYNDIDTELMKAKHNTNNTWGIKNEIAQTIKLEFEKVGFLCFDLLGFEDEMSGDDLLDSIFLFVNNECALIREIPKTKQVSNIG